MKRKTEAPDGAARAGRRVISTQILLVEDSPTQAVQTQLGLESQDFTVIHAANGVEALELARAEPPDAIMSDILMPGMDGFTLLREVRDDPVLSDIPVILHTAHFNAEEDRAFALELGADAFSEKGMAPERLGLLVREVLEKRNAPNTLDEQGFSDRHGDRLLHRLLQLNSDLERANTALSAAVYSLSQQIKRAEDIAGTVNDLADQVTMLALNTSKDAAETGEEHRGASSVADARRLGVQSKQAAERVRGVLSDIRKGIDGALPIRHKTGQVVTGVKLDEGAAELMRELATIEREPATEGQRITDKYDKYEV
jgi:DNA-binding response OmpR family regulator